ncbi:MAG: 1-deoxy-D-xylulose-5-phosphate reductoisomerase [Candidatus Omnitrophica bacterium]|nr:1-deoxy-D-xylulose-5-phosphate reductoisomerase [Candidatus Omnitrophota bacterium]
MKRVAILGSTGSIGINTLKVIESHPDKFEVAALSSYSNTQLLESQVRKFKPSLVTVVDHAKSKEFKKNPGRRKLKLFSGPDGLEQIASSRAIDIVVIAISGACAIGPLLAAIKAGKHICLANKESLVVAGDIIIKKAKRFNASIIPIDSEHSAIFQCISNEKTSKINRIFLTGSGGALFSTPRKRFKSLKVRDVLKHPKWRMGKKITVDSATLMNKGLEIIEAQHLFKIGVDKIKVLIHPEAIIHSMVEFIDGAIIAQLGVTDMRVPIQYALTYPERENTALPMVDFAKVKSLNFSYPDFGKYPCLSLAIVAARLAGTYPAVLNAADEIAVKAFLDKKIDFLKIPKLIEKVLGTHHCVEKPSLGDIMQADRWAREETHRLC